MAGESQYYNPIIEAMIATANFAKTKVDQEQKAKEHDIESKQRDQQLKQVQQQIEQEHAYKLKQHEIAAQQLDIQRKLADAELEQRKVQQLKGFQDILKVGGPDLPKKLPGLFAGFNQQQPQYDFSQPSRGSQLESVGLPAPPQEQPQQPQVDLSSLFNPNAEAEAKARLITAEKTAAQPFDIAEENRKETSAIKLLGLKNQHDLAHLDKQFGYQKELEEIRGRWHLLGSAAMRKMQDQIDPETVKQYLDGMYNGTVDFKQLPIDLKKAITNYAGAIGEADSLPTDYKKVTARITALKSIKPVMAQLEDLAKNYSRDSPGSFSKGNREFGIPLIGGTIGDVASGSEAQAKIQTLEGFLGQFAAYFDNWPGRKSNQEIERMRRGAFNPESTMKDNLHRLAEHTKLIKSGIEDLLVGMKPERARQLLLEHDLDPDKFAGAEIKFEETRTNRTTGQKIGRRGSKWYDVTSGKELGPDGR